MNWKGRWYLIEDVEGDVVWRGEYGKGRVEDKEGGGVEKMIS